MSEDTSQLAAKVWNLAHVMNNAGVGAGDYVEQVTYLLFLKLDAERAEDGLPSLVPEPCRWGGLALLQGAALAKAYAAALEPNPISLDHILLRRTCSGIRVG